MVIAVPAAQSLGERHGAVLPGVGQRAWVTLAEPFGDAVSHSRLVGASWDSGATASVHCPSYPPRLAFSFTVHSCLPVML